MTTARKELVDINVSRWYHCISRCVRGASLLSDVRQHRKQWIEDRLQLLSGSFAIAVGGFSVMDNHLHVLVRLEPERAEQLSSEEVVRRWLAVYPPAGISGDDAKAMELAVSQQMTDSVRVEVLRVRLQNLGWFMKALKEPLSRLANKEDGCRGAFWEARYKSIAILDIQALLATCVYIDLNPVAAGASPTPEGSRYTSLRQRIEHARAQGKLDALGVARQGSVAGSKAAGGLELSHWLVPLEDLRNQAGAESAGGALGGVRAGMLESFSLGTYVQLVDYVGRLHRTGKGRISAELLGVFERLGTSGEQWTGQVKGMLGSGDLRGSYFASEAARVRELSASRGKRLANLTPQPAK
jgi:hypothetical protein